MKKLLVLALVLLGFSSCGKLLDPLYVQLPGTNWYYELDGKRAFINFSDDGKASVLQKEPSSGLAHEINGEYTVAGHNVDIFGSDGTTFNLTRTFSHMKNSKNKNMTRFFPQSYDNLAGKVWAGVDRADLYVYYFKDGENLVRSSFTVTQYEEGVPYGWTKKTIPYTLNGNTFTSEGKTGWLYSEVMLLDGRWHTCFPAPSGGSGSAEMAGTVWIFKGGTSTSAGLLVFDSGYSFTRIQMASTSTAFLMNRGTYTQEGNVLKMNLDGLQDVCTVSGNTFRFMERTYGLLN